MVTEPDSKGQIHWESSFREDPFVLFISVCVCSPRTHTARNAPSSCESVPVWKWSGWWADVSRATESESLFQLKNKNLFILRKPTSGLLAFKSRSSNRVTENKRRGQLWILVALFKLICPHSARPGCGSRSSRQWIGQEDIWECFCYWSRYIYFSQHSE